MNKNIPTRHTPPFRLVIKLPSFLCALLVTNTLCAAVSYVPNSSFETPPTTFADPRVDSWQKAPQPDSFNPVTSGPWDNLAGVFLNPSSGSPGRIENAKGNQLAYIFSYPQVALFQDFNSTDWSNASPTHAFNAKFEAGKSYHLSVGLTSSSQEPLMPGATLAISLYYRDANSNQVVVTSTNVTYDTTLFSNITQLVYFQINVKPVLTNDAWAGQNIGIQFQSTVIPALIGGVWDLDNVVLTESIDVPNFSFESQPTAFADPRVDFWQKPAAPAGFDPSVFGAWENLSGVFQNPPATNSEHITNADGNQLAYLFSYPQVALFQDVNSTDWSNAAPTHAFNAIYKPGRSYALTVGVTGSSEQPLTQGSTLQVSLYYRDASSNMVPVAATTVTYDTNVFNNPTSLIDFSATVAEVKASDPWAGKNIGIQFQSTVSPQFIGGVWDLDNVRLVETVATKLNSAVRTGGQMSFNLQSEPGLSFEILAGTNVTQSVATWTSLANITNVTGSAPFTDSASGLDQRFYRAHLLP